MNTKRVAEAKLSSERRLRGTLSHSSLDNLSKVVFPGTMSNDENGATTSTFTINSIDNANATAGASVPADDSVYALADEGAIVTRDGASDSILEGNGAFIPNHHIENDVAPTGHVVNGSPEPPNDSEIGPEGEEREVISNTAAASPAGTEIIEEDVIPGPPFESTPAPGIIAKDYTRGGPAIMPAPSIFTALPIYIWFLYMRDTVRTLRPYIHFHCDASAFAGCEIVLLVHFNWVTVEECFWMDARYSLGAGLLLLRDRPINHRLPPGTVRPAEDAPVVQNYHERFTNSRYLEQFRERASSGMYEQPFDDQDRRAYGHFGEAVYNSFPMEERPKLLEMYEYLCGRGPMPDCSPEMKHLFAPILHCRNGGVGGRGEPYELPRREGAQPMEGTEEEEVDIDPELVALENAPVFAFCLIRQQEESDRRREMREALAREAEEAQTRGTEGTQAREEEDTSAHDAGETQTREVEETDAKEAESARVGSNEKATTSTGEISREDKGKGKAVDGKQGRVIKTNSKIKGKGKASNPVPPSETKGPHTRAATAAVATAAAKEASDASKDEPQPAAPTPAPEFTGRCTRSRTAAAKAAKATSGPTRAEKGKGKAVEPLPLLDPNQAETGDKRARDNDEDIGDINPACAIQDVPDPGPSRRSTRRTRYKAEMPAPPAPKAPTRARKPTNKSPAPAKAPAARPRRGAKKSTVAKVDPPKAIQITKPKPKRGEKRARDDEEAPKAGAKKTSKRQVKRVPASTHSMATRSSGKVKVEHAETVLATPSVSPASTEAPADIKPAVRVIEPAAPTPSSLDIAALVQHDLDTAVPVEYNPYVAALVALDLAAARLAPIVPAPVQAAPIQAAPIQAAPVAAVPVVPAPVLAAQPLRRTETTLLWGRVFRD